MILNSIVILSMSYFLYQCCQYPTQSLSHLVVLVFFLHDLPDFPFHFPSLYFVLFPSLSYFFLFSLIFFFPLFFFPLVFFRLLLFIFHFSLIIFCSVLFCSVLLYFSSIIFLVLLALCLNTSSSLPLYLLFSSSLL